jgi:hypothetical protein
MMGITWVDEQLAGLASPERLRSMPMNLMQYKFCDLKSGKKSKYRCHRRETEHAQTKEE